MYPDLVVVTVTVEAIPAGTFVTVTRPVVVLIEAIAPDLELVTA